jgi:S-DNA-T family DNA segregation ATPase FtsK/SpoIIIE
MARPAKSSRKKTQAKRSDSGLSRLGLYLARWVSGPAGRQVLALILIAFGLLSLVTIAGLNSGALVNAWARFLVRLFGWAAYPVAALISATGLLWLRHLVHQATAWRWRPFVGFELVLIGLQTLTFALIKQNSWRLIETGRGGGVIGWALFLFFSDYFGPLVTGVFMGFLVVLGLCLAFDLRARDLREFGQRLTEVWAAFRADWRERAARRRRVRAALRAEQAAAQQHTARGAQASTPAQGESQPTAETQQKPTPQPAKSRSRSRRRQPTKAPQRIAPLSLLQSSQTSGVDPEEIERKSRIIEETLAQFQVPVRVTEVRKGPTVTQFGVSPGYVNRGSGGRQRKVRVSQISSLSDDLTLALAAESLRVEAPVPGRAVVGIEVPNSGTSLVTLRTVLESETFEDCGKPLCFAVGLDVDGSPRVADLSRMPHLLVAGTTGSGKSVFIKALAASLVMYNSPETLRLVAIDPKMVELSHLNGLPHLLGTAESDMEDSLRVLRWVAHEMDRRYKLFSEAIARNLDDYNAKLARRRRKADEDSRTEEDEDGPLPRIVVLIDELADLMMSAPEETERTLTRIAQMARATGIHLVVATQRPSTDVVTGLIKANFPARVSFATASVVDSRVILDTTGAESLLGLGDLLFLPPDASAPIRVQGCFISNDEMEAIIRFWQHEIGATPSKAPWEVIAETQGPESWRIEGMDEDADLLEKALAYAKGHGKISTSGLQRKLRIGYPRAARLMEQMEEMGVVGPQVSAGRKRRVILGDDE